MSNLKRWREHGQGNFVKWTEPGQTLEGRWHGQQDGKYGPIGILETEHGRVTFPLHTALLQRVEDLPLNLTIKILYTGKQESKQGRTFKAFTVYVPEDYVAPARDPDDVPLDDDVPF